MAYSNGHKIQRVFPLLLELEKDDDDYIPHTVSFGPYHYGEARLAFVEAFKPEAVELFISDGPNDEEFYYDRVFGIIDEERDCYVWPSTPPLLKDLALMMLRDATFIISYMEVWAGTLDCPVASYINLMKSLIEDVKELRERRILFNTMGSDQEVLNVFKEELRNSLQVYGYNYLRSQCAYDVAPGGL